MYVNIDNYIYWYSYLSFIWPKKKWQTYSEWMSFDYWTVNEFFIIITTVIYLICRLFVWNNFIFLLSASTGFPLVIFIWFFLTYNIKGMFYFFVKQVPAFGFWNFEKYIPGLFYYFVMYQRWEMLVINKIFSNYYWYQNVRN